MSKKPLLLLCLKLERGQDVRAIAIREKEWMLMLLLMLMRVVREGEVSEWMMMVIGCF